MQEVQQASLEASCGLRWKLNGGGRTSLEAVGGGCHGTWRCELCRQEVAAA